MTIAGLALLAAVSAQPPSCTFKYTPEFHDAVAAPRMKADLGAAWTGWDDPKPQVTISGDLVILTFDSTRPGTVDGPSFVLWIKNCGKGAVSSGWAPSTLDIRR
jgi:hypothetical protein